MQWKIHLVMFRAHEPDLQTDRTHFPLPPPRNHTPLLPNMWRDTTFIIKGKFLEMFLPKLSN